ncbi:hypothetical protein B0T14DRAFT_571684 [Immersiella caudata]|uniref:Uncharacterized protein n=1 Tax=Immersiella caudata TaxID=314043 RepID=A0AA39TT69_9PEZI|nr:hypothetical protein B0T14DRAFT_571684 [Immersiella caudata]
MYHTKEASDPRDKLYALLGMSSDRQRYAQLSPYYNIPWHGLLHQLIKLLINGNALSIEISLWASTTNQSKPESILETQWVLQPYAKSILLGDTICALNGASTPTIIRPYADYCTIVAISITPTMLEEVRQQTNGWRQLMKSTSTFPYTGLLVWDWIKGESDHQTYRVWMQHGLPHCCETDLQNRGLACQKTRHKMLEAMKAWSVAREYQRTARQKSETEELDALKAAKTKAEEELSDLRGENSILVEDLMLQDELDEYLKEIEKSEKKLAESEMEILSFQKALRKLIRELQQQEGKLMRQEGWFKLLKPSKLSNWAASALPALVVIYNFREESGWSFR